ncbi:hypothetical protein B0H11DRAFT_1912571 [Mycena galericulata]|nr:hypothetical protein B0H11DRAFT_1912571 [Mycena galericulata]
MFRDLKRRGEETWTAPLLARGKKKVHAALAPESSVYQPELEEDQEEKEREDEEEDELVRGDVSDDEELLMGVGQGSGREGREQREQWVGAGGRGASSGRSRREGGRAGASSRREGAPRQSNGQ